MPWIPNEALEPTQALQYMITLLERIDIMADRLDRNVQNQMSQTEAYKQLADQAQARATELQGIVDQLTADGSANVELVSQLQQQVTDLQAAIDRNNEILEGDDEPVTETPEPTPVDPDTGEPITTPDEGAVTEPGGGEIVTDPETGEPVVTDPTDPTNGEGNQTTPPPPGT